MVPKPGLILVMFFTQGWSITSALFIIFAFIESRDIDASPYSTLKSSSGDLKDLGVLEVSLSTWLRKVCLYERLHP